MNEDGIIGTCHWKACQKCKYYDLQEGCTRACDPALETFDGDVYCCDFKMKD